VARLLVLFFLFFSSLFFFFFFFFSRIRVAGGIGRNVIELAGHGTRAANKGAQRTDRTSRFDHSTHLDHDRVSEMLDFAIANTMEHLQTGACTANNAYPRWKSERLMTLSDLTPRVLRVLEDAIVSSTRTAISRKPLFGTSLFRSALDDDSVNGDDRAMTARRGGKGEGGRRGRR